MRVFVAGATGAIGRQLLPLLVDAGHEVVGLTRSQTKRSTLEAAGARPVVADALSAEQLHAALRSSEPEVVVHELTAIPASVDPRRFAEDFAPTNRIRREGTRNLVAAALAAGARRIVAESISQACAPAGGWVKVEEDPLHADAPEVFRDTFRAVIDLEQAVLGAGETVLGAGEAETVVLRYGNFYGPGTAYAADGAFGRFGMLEARGASNAKARAELGWAPGHSSWRQGFAADLA